MIGTLAEKVNAKQRRLLFYILIGVVGAHVLALVAFGSVVIFRHLFKKEAEFVAPPEALKRIEPQKLEHKVKLQKSQQKSGRPRVQPRLSAAKISDFALPEVKVQVSPVKDPIKASNLRSFGANGVGTGTAGGSGSGGLGIGISQARFMGFSAKTERLAVMVDLSPSMVEDQRGGFDGFDALKEEIKELVSSLSGGSFFNLVTFGVGVDRYNSEAVIASKVNKKEAEDWIDPYMTDRVNVKANGTRSSSVELADTTPKMKAQGGLTRFDLAFAAVFESGVDTIFLVSDGDHFIVRDETPDEKAAREKREGEVSRQELARRQKILDDRQKEDEARAKRGLPPKVVEKEGFTGPPLYGDDDVIAYLYDTAKALYSAKGKEMPKLYIIGYATSPNEEGFLKKLATKFKGHFRRARSLVKPVDAPKP